VANAIEPETTLEKLRFSEVECCEQIVKECLV
jgi:hypothetical protein